MGRPQRQTSSKALCIGVAVWRSLLGPVDYWKQRFSWIDVSVDDGGRGSLRERGSVGHPSEAKQNERGYTAHVVDDSGSDDGRSRR